MSTLRPGLELTEVRKDVNLEGRENRGKPGNPYLDGKSRGNGGRAVERCMNLKTTGWGPSKMNADNSIPKLSDDERAVLLFLDQVGAVHEDYLASGSKLSHAACIATLDALKKRAMVCEVTRGWTLQAEGRRVAELIAKQPPPKKRKRA